MIPIIICQLLIYVVWREYKSKITLLKASLRDQFSIVSMDNGSH